MHSLHQHSVLCRIYLKAVNCRPHTIVVNSTLSRELTCQSAILMSAFGYIISFQIDCETRL